MTEVKVETKGLEPLGSQLLIKGVEHLVTSGGIYVGTGEKSPDKYDRDFVIAAIGDEADDKVKSKLSIGDKVFINWIPTMHPTIKSEETKEAYTFWFVCNPADIKCKITQ